MTPNYSYAAPDDRKDNDDMDDDELKLCGEVGKNARAFVRKYMQLRAYADELNARCVADAADAERYRWLRDAPRADVRIVGRGARKGDALDATVDELRGAA